MIGAAVCGLILIVAGILWQMDKAVPYTNSDVTIDPDSPVVAVALPSFHSVAYRFPENVRERMHLDKNGFGGIRLIYDPSVESPVLEMPEGLEDYLAYECSDGVFTFSFCNPDTAMTSPWYRPYIVCARSITLSMASMPDSLSLNWFSSIVTLEGFTAENLMLDDGGYADYILDGCNIASIRTDDDANIQLADSWVGLITTGGKKLNLGADSLSALGAVDWNGKESGNFLNLDFIAVGDIRFSGGELTVKSTMPLNISTIGK